MQPDDCEALRAQLLANGASALAAAWRVGDAIDDLPPDPGDLDHGARAQQDHALEAGRPVSPAREGTMNHDLDRDRNSRDGRPLDRVELRIRTWTRGSAEDERKGLLGFVSLAYGDLVLDGLVIRRTSDGRLTISWPERRDRQGRAHPYVRPINDEARRRIEKAVFGAATAAEEAPW